MKKIKSLFALVIAFCFTTVSLAQTTETTQDISVPVQSVIIYLYGAEVSQSKTITLAPGRNKITFTGLSPKLDSKSIQVSASGNVAILAISDAVNYMSNQKESNRIKLLKDSVTILSDGISAANNDKDAYMTEKNMLLKNESIGGQDKGVAITELKLAADFYRARIKEINTEISKLDKKRNTLQESLTKINQQLNELNAKNNQPTSEISVLISSSAKISSTVDLKYLVSDAGWAPSYDLHAEDINLPIELKYRAKVYNNTGIDWNDVKLKLSTADPSKSASKPELLPWDLTYVSVQKNRNVYAKQKSAAPAYQSGEGYMQNSISNSNEISIQKSIPAKPNVQFVEIEIAELSAEFEIKTPYTFPSDSKPYIVDVTEYKLPATFQHFSAPKLDRDAFLLARITGWEDLDLVEGPANVYYGGTFVGQSYIYTRSADDTLDLSLGRDNKVLVTRSKVKEFNTKKYIGNTTKETFAYEMMVKNNRKTPIQIEVEDQLPISTQSDVTVDAIETTKAEFDAKTGKLVWKYTLQPGEVKKIELSFSVKYPKNSKINTQKFRTVSSPSF
ncbi:MAG: mucoidy inhibitor MuiA family protein [Bacteroidetes bacterium]|nr:mucoidy inhibitor MuiA family protein [Bacteroidota bacterium]